MTLSQLIDRLEDYRLALGDTAEVRLMTQQSWPFQNALAGVVSGEEINTTSENEEEDDDVDDDQTVYLVEGDQLGYGSKLAWRLAQ